MPRLDMPSVGRLLPIPGLPPSLINLPTGCSFHPRCAYEPLTGGLGKSTMPELVSGDGTGHLVRCHLPRGERQRIWATEVKPKIGVE
jgi:peptide/nickel transport system ATP-binding protein